MSLNKENESCDNIIMKVRRLLIKVIAIILAINYYMNDHKSYLQVYVLIKNYVENGRVIVGYGALLHFVECMRIFIRVYFRKSSAGET